MVDELKKKILCFNRFAIISSKNIWMATFLTPVQNFHDMNVSSEDQPDNAMGKADMSCTCHFKSRSVNSEISASRKSLDKKETATSWSEFAQDTTMHGVRYVNVAESPKAAR